MCVSMIASVVRSAGKTGVLAALRRSVTERQARRSPLGTMLNELRRRKRFSLRGLAEAAELSATTVAQLENGYDPRTGKLIEPNPRTLRLLAGALSDGDEGAADEIYRGLMTSAGYTVGFREESEPAYVEPAPTADVISRMIQQSADFTENDKRFLADLLERTRRIARGKGGQ